TWSGMSAGQHFIQVFYDDNTLALQATRLVTVTIFGQTDTDGDGLPDVWEQQQVPPLDAHDATGDNGPDGDPDHDGFTNLQEYIAGTNPRDPNSLLKITTIANSGRVITWSSVPGKNYQVYATTNVAFEVEPLSGTITAFSATTSYTNTAPGAAQQFYRVRVMP